MEKMYVKKEELNEEEKRTGRVSYARLVDWIIGEGLVLCNNIVDIDENIFDNMNENYYNEEEEGEEYPDIFQWYLCNLNEWQIEKAKECGLILSYSEMLDLDVLCVEHWGTSWNYVMTDVEWTENN